MLDQDNITLPPIIYPQILIEDLPAADLSDLDLEAPLDIQLKMQYKKNNSFLTIFNQIFGYLMSIFTYFMAGETELQNNKSIESLDLENFLDLTRGSEKDMGNRYLVWSTIKKISSASAHGWGNHPNIYIGDSSQMATYSEMRKASNGKKSYIENSINATQYVVDLHWFECFIGMLKMIKMEFHKKEKKEAKKKLIDTIKNLNVAIQNRIENGNLEAYSKEYYLANLQKCMAKQEYYSIAKKDLLTKFNSMKRLSSYTTEIVEMLKYKRNDPLEILNLVVEQIYGDIIYHASKNASLGQYDVARYLCKSLFVMIHHPKYLNIGLKNLSNYNISRLVNHFNYLVSKIAVSEVDMGVGRRALVVRGDNSNAKILQPKIELEEIKYSKLTKYFYRINEILPGYVATNMVTIRYFDSWIDILNKSPEDLLNWKIKKIAGQKYAFNIQKYNTTANLKIRVYITKRRPDDVRRVRIFIPEKVASTKLDEITKNILNFLKKLPKNTRFLRLINQAKKVPYRNMPKCKYGLNNRLKLMPIKPTWDTQYIFEGKINSIDFLEAYLLDQQISKILMLRYGLIAKKYHNFGLDSVCQSIKYRYQPKKKYKIEKNMTSNYGYLEKLFSGTFLKIPQLLDLLDSELKAITNNFDNIANNRRKNYYTSEKKSNWFDKKNVKIGQIKYLETRQIYAKLKKITKIMNYINRLKRIKSLLKKTDLIYPKNSIFAPMIKMSNTVKYFMIWYNLPNIVKIMEPVRVINYEYWPDMRHLVDTLLTTGPLLAEYIEVEYFEKLLVKLLQFNISEQLLDTSTKIILQGSKNSLEFIDTSLSIDGKILNEYYLDGKLKQYFKNDVITKNSKKYYEELNLMWQAEGMHNRNSKVVKHIAEKMEDYVASNVEYIENIRAEYLFIKAP